MDEGIWSFVPERADCTRRRIDLGFKESEVRDELQRFSI